MTPQDPLTPSVPLSTSGLSEVAGAIRESLMYFGINHEACEEAIARAEETISSLSPAHGLQGGVAGRSGVYVASRASLPERGQMWRGLRAAGVPINSTWIDEDGPKASRDLSGLWTRIVAEVTGSERLVLYVEPDDFPLKGALIEIGAALAAGVPVVIVAPGVQLEPRNCRPLGSWIKHPLVSFADSVDAALSSLASSPIQGDGQEPIGCPCPGACSMKGPLSPDQRASIICDFMNWPEDGPAWADAHKLAAKLVSPKPDVTALVEAVTASAQRFRAYAVMHTSKGTPDGDAKAQTNTEMAEMCERALSAFQDHQGGA